jgi:2,4-dienoyl-CoA reductase-like NADH-dependent reductase (Old Yellow Enzyme family)
MMDTPLLFEPLSIRDMTLKNRIVISPMCQHAADFGKATDWHLVHLEKFAIGGAGLILVESTAVDPRARIGVNDVGLWSDDQIEPLRRVCLFAQSNGAKIGVQLAHAITLRSPPCDRRRALAPDGPQRGRWPRPDNAATRRKGVR